MKNLIRPFLVTALFGCFILLTINCSSDGAVADETQAPHSTNREGVKNIVVGYIDENDKYVVYQDSVAFVKEQWEKAYDVTITSFTIEKDFTIADPNTNDPGGEEYYMLFANTTTNQRIGWPLFKALKAFLASTPSFSVSCIGCTEGCHVKAIGGNGALAYICDNPCSTCSKSETLTGAPMPTNP